MNYLKNFEDPHLKHEVFELAWYVPEGEITAKSGDLISVLTKCSFIFIPEITVHHFCKPE